MLPLGTEAPNFKLWDTVSDSIKSLNKVKGPNGTMVMFICNHCPYVKAVIEDIVQDVFLKVWEKPIDVTSKTIKSLLLSIM